jgi:hypothetical protein
MFAQNPKKEFIVKFDETQVKEAILKLTSIEPNNYSLVKNDEILNEIKILRKGQLLDVGYHIDFTMSKTSELETKIIVEVSRNIGTINTASEVSIANNILKSVTSKFSSYISGDVNSETGKANVPKQGCYVATSIYGSYDAPEVLVLRNYRDNNLSKTLFGKAFIQFYYTTSPSFVKLTKNMDTLNLIIKRQLDKLVCRLINK